MTPAAAARHRLAHQGIALSPCVQPAEVVARLGAMQAQDYAGALWAIGLRLPGSTETEIEKALAARAIVRTWPLRGTLHFVAAADVRWMLQFLSPRIVAGAAGRHRELGLDEKTFARCEKVLARALQGGHHLTREEIFATLERSKIPVDQHRGYHILWRLAQAGLLCFGARRGKQLTFTLLEEWIPPAAEMNREEALAGLARRYFSSHGPATLADFAWWAGLKISEARAALDAVSSGLARETIDQKIHWMPPDQPALSRATAGVFLLPGFDEYMLGYQDRSAALPPCHAQKIAPGGNGIFLPTIVKNGQVVGTWKRTLKSKSVSLVAGPFTTLDQPTHRAVATAAQRYARFLGLSLTGDS